MSAEKYEEQKETEDFTFYVFEMIFSTLSFVELGAIFPYQRKIIFSSFFFYN
jgi:hypothetical protein